jgi:hypothetical protein
LAGGGVFGTPYEGAIGLLIWGVELWPYLNGQAITAGLRLSSLDSVDLLDVLHYFFEIDHKYSTAEEAESHSKLRSGIYSTFYKKTYNYGYSSSNKSYNYSTASGASGDNYAGTNVDDPINKKPPTKPFVPSTNFDPESPAPFGPTLDPPAG